MSVEISKNISRHRLFIPLDNMKRCEILDKIEEFFIAVDDAIASLGQMQFPKPIILTNILRCNPRNEDVKILVDICMFSIEPYFRTKAFYYSVYGMIDNSKLQEDKVVEIKTLLLETEEKLTTLSNQVEKLKSEYDNLRYSEKAKHKKKIEKKEFQIETMKEQVVHLRYRMEKAQSNTPTFILLGCNDLVDNKPYTEIDMVSREQVSTTAPYTTVAFRFFDRRDSGEIQKIRTTIWDDCNLSAEYQKFWNKLNNAVRSKNSRPNNQHQIREENIAVKDFWNSNDRSSIRKLYDALSEKNLIESRKFHIFAGAFSGYFPQNAQRESRKRKIKWLVQLERKSKHSNTASLYWLVIALKDLKLFYTYYYKAILKDKINFSDSIIMNFIEEYFELSDVEIINRIKIEVSIDTLKNIVKYFTYEDGSVISSGDFYYANLGETIDRVDYRTLVVKTLKKYTKALESLNEVLYPFIEEYCEFEKIEFKQDALLKEWREVYMTSEANSDKD